MKKLNTILLLLVMLCASTAPLRAQRYLSEVFDDVDIETGVLYAVNWTVLTVPITGHSAKQPLTMDIYTPTDDTETARPLVLFFRTGNFLPNPQNGGVTGTKNDSVTVEICTRLAKMGYVVANVDYRLGWNPISDDINVRISTLINAAYRGVQDASSCVRFFRKSVEEDGNPYGICPDKITLFGEGTGGYITLAASTLDQYFDIVIGKFIGPDIDGNGTPDPFVIEAFNGDLKGETLVGLNPLNGDTLAVPNTPGYDSDVQLCVNVGGALGDTSWLDASDPPMISYHVPDDPNAPYVEAILIVPTTGDLIVEVQGSYLVAQRSNAVGNNDVFVNANITDEYTTAADNFNDGYEGLFPFNRPLGVNPLSGQPAPEGAPWQWWNSAFWSTIEHPTCVMLGLPVSICNFHVLASIGNNNMSATLGRTYVDSIIGYYAPRAFAALQLGTDCVLGTDNIEAVDVELSTSPNPAQNAVVFSSNAEFPMQSIEIYSISGQLMQTIPTVNSNRHSVQRNGLPNGLYLARVQFEQGVVTQKIVFE